MRSIPCCGVAPILILAACAGQDPAPVPALHFAMYYGASYDPEPFNLAWNAARQDPSLGVDYTFPLITTDLAPGTQLRLLAGRSPNDPGYPPTTGDDVIIADELELTTVTTGDDDGAVEFPPLAVSTGGVTSDTATLPAALLCGATVIAARAYEPGTGEVPAYRFLASTFFVVVSACE